MKKTKKDYDVFNLLLELWTSLAAKRKSQFYFFCVLSLFASLTEIISVGIIIPFLAVLSSPDFFYQKPLVHQFFLKFNINSADEILLPIVIAFIFAALISGLLRFVLLRSAIYLSFLTGSDLSTYIYTNSLNRDYMYHLKSNSSNLIDGLTVKSHNIIYYILLPICNLVSNFFLILAIISILFFVNPIIAFSSFLFFTILYLLIANRMKKRIAADGYLISGQSRKSIKMLQEGFGGIRNILIDNNQTFFIEAYNKAEIEFRKAQANNFFAGQSPRILIEAIAIALIAFFAYFFTLSNSNSFGALPILGVFAIGMQKLLPLFQQTYNSWTNLQTGKASLIEILDLLNSKDIKEKSNNSSKNLLFHNSIIFKNISFKYNLTGPWIIKNLNLEITKGSRIGIIGKTGAGKSTLIDIFLGLLNPQKGYIYIDNRKFKSLNLREWQNSISHVPQFIFLSDSTITENIAFGVKKELIDIQRVELAAKQAQISNDIELLPRKYQTLVGERGSNLSGGQIQRIGIARALYKKANIIIFDEATNSVDARTEYELMNSIRALNKDLTLIIIAHRMSALKVCDCIYKVENGHLKKHESK